MVAARVRRRTVIVHIAHYFDGYPLCWPMDADGDFEATRVDADVTCPECRKIIAQPNGAG